MAKKKPKSLLDTPILTTQDLVDIWQKTRTKKGWVYISVNDKSPETLKIGITQKDPFVRAKSLTTAGVEGKYRPLFALLYADCTQAETCIHMALSKFNLEKELFKVPVEVAKEELLRKYKEDEEAVKPFDIKFLLFDQTPNRWINQALEAKSELTI